MLVWIQNPFDNLPPEGFRKQRYWMMAEAFVRAGHEVVYWTSDFSHARKKLRSCEVAELRDFEVRLIPTPPYSKNVSLARIRSHRAYAKEWLRLARETERPDLIVTSAPTLSAALAALGLGRMFGVKVVVDVQDAWPETFERLAPRGFRWLAHLLLAPWRMDAQSMIYRKADLVTGVCDRYRELTGRKDYYRAYLGIEVPRVDFNAEAQRHGEIRLVYAGGLGKTYDLKTLVKAVEANREMTLDVAGFGDFSCNCPRVKFHGALSAPDLQRLFSTCDMGVVPMNGDSCVGLPNKIFDYAAAGLGIVSSLGGESAELLKRYRCGTTYNPGDVASLTAAIRKATTLARGASRTMCAAEFDARVIYDAYVSHVIALPRP